MISSVYKGDSKETKLLKYFTICKTDQSHVNKIKYCLEEPFQLQLAVSVGWGWKQ